MEEKMRIIAAISLTALLQSAAFADEIMLQAFSEGSPFATSSSLVAEDLEGETDETVHVLHFGSPRSVVSHFEKGHGCWLHGTDWHLEDARTRKILSHILNKGTLPDGYYAATEDGVAWVATAWIPYDKCMIKSAEDCNPKSKWTACNGKTEVKYCIEKKSKNDFTVHMKKGAKGFALSSFGLSKLCAENWADEKIWQRTGALESSISTDYSEALEDRYLIVAIGSNRRVTFKLYKEDGSLDRQVEPDQARPGPVVVSASSDSNTQRVNTCGGAHYACPMFYDPEIRSEREEIMRIFESLPQELKPDLGRP